MKNTVQYVKVLESAGITREQAEAQIQVITEITEGDLATKQDIKNLETDMKGLEAKLDMSVERLEHKLLQSEYRLTIKLGTIVTVVIAAATTVIKLL